MSATALILLCSLSTVLGDETPKGVMRFPISRQVPLREHVANLAKRDEGISIDLLNELTMFATILELGSDKQKVEVLVDTGSSDLWVMSSSNPYCSSITDSRDISNKADKNGKIQCGSYTMFNTSTSSSWSSNDTDFSISYGDYTFAKGTYGQDTVSYGGVSIEKGNFAVADRANSTTAVWGIGLPSLESLAHNVASDGKFFPTYPNLPQQMKEQGIIGHNAYSLWLNDIDSDIGELLFGGVDHSKYSGTLQTVPIVSSYPRGIEPIYMQVMLNGISLYQESTIQKVATFSLPAILDSGTTIILMPLEFIEPIASSIGAEYSPYGYVGPCDLDGGLTFDFSGAEIHVPFKQLAYDRDGDKCFFGISPSGSSEIILGDTFLRSAYVVYDLENLEISLANTKYNISSSSIEAISSSVPRATKAKRYSSTQTISSYSTTTATGFKKRSESIMIASHPTGSNGTIRASQTPSEVVASKSQESKTPSTSITSSDRDHKGSSENGASTIKNLSVVVSLLHGFTAVITLLMLL